MTAIIHAFPARPAPNRITAHMADEFPPAPTAYTDGDRRVALHDLRMEMRQVIAAADNAAKICAGTALAQIVADTADNLRTVELTVHGAALLMSGQRKDGVA